MIGAVRTKSRNRLSHDKLMQILRVKFFISKKPKVETSKGKMRDFETSDFTVPEVKIFEDIFNESKLFL